MKKENGITIVALSVTIIVLLILAGISIKLVLDNNGIIGNAQTAKNQYTEAEANTEQGIGELSNALSSNLNHNRDDGTNTTTNTVNPTPTPEPTKYTLTINAGAGTTTGSTNVQGTSGSKVTVSTPTPPSGYTVTLNGNDGVIGTSSTASFKTTYSFSRWNLSGGGSISGTTYSYSTHNVTNINAYDYTSGRGRNTLAVDKSVNKFSYQLNNIPAGTAKTQTFKMYYRVKGSNGYQLKEVQESVSSGGSLRLTVEDSNLMDKKVFVYVVIINSDGTRTLVKEAWIDSSVSPWKTYYAEA